MFRRFLRGMRNNVLVGLFLTVPIVATVLIFNFLFRLTTSWLPDSLFPRFQTFLHGYPLRILTLLAVLVFFYMVGLLTRNMLGRRLYQLGDKLLGRIPIIKSIYVSVRHISEALFTQRKTLFKEVVLVQYPRAGIYSLAFVTAVAPPSIVRQLNRDQAEECVSLFIATTPNPTSGVFILAPRSEVLPLNVPVSDALTFIMSAGAVEPGTQGETAPTLLDKLEDWLRHGDGQGAEATHAAD